MQKTNTRALGFIGKHLAAAQLECLGFRTECSSSSSEITFYKDKRTFKAIVVTTTADGWMLRASRETLLDSDIFYIFVKLDSNNSPEYHIAPSAHVASYIFTEHREWLARPSKRGGKPHQDNNVRIFYDKYNVFLDRWDLITKDYTPQKIREETPKKTIKDNKDIVLPDGTYTLCRKKKIENRVIKATATVKNGCWTILKGSIFGIKEGHQSYKEETKFRNMAHLDSTGTLLEDLEIGICKPSFASNLVMHAETDGWYEWKNRDGQGIDVYRERA